ncbi:hypothetical protein [Mucilaginibacter pedocola]|uniref:TonB C-terminal domain-containing protein n=1 Tax=Mucilaginibacter pedocola TaxID=1792845 RepID=A0A1S9PLP0_9SPHI|nr:hypothetical protein [Mucilaginibacter pedocola]OOQ61886.1 hypothetical protein BC343_02140 [Mucilaginibacter pedocola]
MKYLIFILLFCCLNVSAQVSKYYIAANGQQTTKPNKATSYLLIEKLDQDSAYLVTQYDMLDTIMFKGTYKDSTMKIPHGKFTTYAKFRIPADYNVFKSTTDTNTYVSSSGYYLNGLKSGAWVTYYKRGKKSDISYYQDGKLNGLFQAFTKPDEDLITEGYMVNDKREGIWHMLEKGAYYEAVFENDKLKKKTLVEQNAYPENDFLEYVLDKMRRFRQAGQQQEFYFEATINSKGEVKDPKVLSEPSPDADKTLRIALLHAPRFTAAVKDRVKVEQNVKLRITFIPPTSKTGRMFITQTLNESVKLPHVDSPAN